MKPLQPPPGGATPEWRARLDLLNRAWTPQPVPDASPRPRVSGKFFFVGERKLYVRGVTYGTFRPRGGIEFPEPPQVEADFGVMAWNAVNAVRTYAPPPRWLLDSAARHGLRVLVGLPSERYIELALGGKRDAPAVANLVRGWMSECIGHPAVLGYSVGNGISATVARWHGPKRVAAYLERFYRSVKATDPDALVTYANYPSTEYLELPFLDFTCFNVFLESPERLDAYLPRLQRLADDRPLVIGELGLDGHRNGDDTQSRSLARQIRCSFEAGCAGLFVYSWTDEWYRDGEVVDGWAFGLTRKNRQPKPALAAVRGAFARSPFAADIDWPRMSVIVCTYNGARTLEETLGALENVHYPGYEVIVVNDGSTDRSADIASRYRCRIVTTENRGLSHARNLGLAEATGSIIAYLDDDAYPDPHWLRYLALTFLHSSHAGVGGPNLPPAGDGWAAQCVANAPGNPVHVLISDGEAEHIPGCNMAFRKDALAAVGGFDPLFRVAGDDVDLCWRLADAGLTLGFSPAAVVWHHRRNSLRAFWRQQVGYGRAEGMLERKWPARHDAAGNVNWAGRIYGRGLIRRLGWKRGRVYQGVWGSAPFQSLYELAPTGWAALMQSPTWYLLTAALGALALLGLDWTPLLVAVVPVGLAAAASVLQAGKSAAHATFQETTAGRWGAMGMWVVTTLLYLAQPAARIWGRVSFAFRHPRRRHPWRLRDLRASTTATWTEEHREAATRLAAIEGALREQGVGVRRGGDFDRWDLEAHTGPLGAARILLAVELHERGHQLVRVRLRPRETLGIPLLAIVLFALAIGADRAGAIVAALVMGFVAMAVVGRMIIDHSAAMGAARRALARVGLTG